MALGTVAEITPAATIDAYESGLSAGLETLPDPSVVRPSLGEDERDFEALLGGCREGLGLVTAYFDDQGTRLENPRVMNALQEGVRPPATTEPWSFGPPWMPPPTRSWGAQLRHLQNDLRIKNKRGDVSNLHADVRAMVGAFDFLEASLGTRPGLVIAFQQLTLPASDVFEIRSLPSRLFGLEHVLRSILGTLDRAVRPAAQAVDLFERISLAALQTKSSSSGTDRAEWPFGGFIDVHAMASLGIDITNGSFDRLEIGDPVVLRDGDRFQLGIVRSKNSEGAEIRVDDRTIRATKQEINELNPLMVGDSFYPSMVGLGETLRSKRFYVTFDPGAGMFVSFDELEDKWSWAAEALPLSIAANLASRLATLTGAYAGWATTYSIFETIHHWHDILESGDFESLQTDPELSSYPEPSEFDQATLHLVGRTARLIRRVEDEETVQGEPTRSDLLDGVLEGLYRGQLEEAVALQLSRLIVGFPGSEDDLGLIFSFFPDAQRVDYDLDADSTEVFISAGEGAEDRLRTAIASAWGPTTIFVPDPSLKAIGDRVVAIDPFATDVTIEIGDAG